MSGHCRDCRWMGAFAGMLKTIIGGEEHDSGHYLCARIREVYPTNDLAPDLFSERALVCEMGAKLLVLPGFGCVLFEVRDE